MGDGNDVAVAGPLSKNRVVKPKASRSNAAKWNHTVMRRLWDALATDPEADITTLLPSKYQEVLHYKKTKASTSKLFPDRDVRSRLDPTVPATIISTLSAELETLLSLKGHRNLSEAIVDLLAKSSALFQAAAVNIFRVGEGIAVKITRVDYAATEHHSLSYLRQHLPSFPVPEPHGMIRFGDYGLLFTTFVPGRDLEKAWPQLDDIQKRAVSCQIDALLVELRSLQLPPGSPLGGVQGEGCKDIRKGLRVNSEPIENVEQFQDFIFAGSRAASPVYIQFLRDLIPASPPRVVFTHGDVRPANIMIDMDRDGSWKVVAIIDWEASGFYPEYWECVKMTNNLSAVDRSDWYLYLPESVSPCQYPIHWLVDRIWDRSLVHS